MKKINQTAFRIGGRHGERLMKKNDCLTAVIDGYTGDGAGVAHVDGMAVFVPGTIRGEKAELHIVKTLKTYAYAKVERIIEHSPERIQPDCPVYQRCGGCTQRHMSYTEELRYKEKKVADAFERIAGVKPQTEPILPSPMIDGYRNRAQFPTACVDGKAVCGFYRTNSHDVIPTDYCRLQTPEAAKVADAVIGWMNRFDISAYDEKSGRGLVRHICVRTSFCDRNTVLTLVVSSSSVPHADELCTAVSAVNGVTGIVINVNSEHTNVILGTRFYTLWGKDTLEERLGKLRFTLRPASFFQVNPVQAENLYTIAKEYLTRPEKEGNEPYRPKNLLDLYCGTGTIGLFCADVCDSVTGVEIVESAVRDAKENAAANGVDNAGFYCGDAGKITAELTAKGKNFDTVIVDPPRKGLSDEAAAMLLKLAPERIVYVSCDPATLARDVVRLSGEYKPSVARAVDMFPRTSHVETVVQLVRKKPDTVLDVKSI